MAPSSFTPSVATPEERFWHDLDLRGKTVYDIGAFHGSLTLFFAVRAKSVVSFEPNSRDRAQAAGESADQSDSERPGAGSRRRFATGEPADGVGYTHPGQREH